MLGSCSSVRRALVPWDRMPPQNALCAATAFGPPTPLPPPPQVWEDVRKEEGVHTGKVGPLGTTDRCAAAAAGRRGRSVRVFKPARKRQNSAQRSAGMAATVSLTVWVPGAAAVAV